MLLLPNTHLLPLPYWLPLHYYCVVLDYRHSVVTLVPLVIGFPLLLIAAPFAFPLPCRCCYYPLPYSVRWLFLYLWLLRNSTLQFLLLLLVIACLPLFCRLFTSYLDFYFTLLLVPSLLWIGTLRSYLPWWTVTAIHCLVAILFSLPAIVIAFGFVFLYLPSITILHIRLRSIHFGFFTAGCTFTVTRCFLTFLRAFIAILNISPLLPFWI